MKISSTIQQSIEVEIAPPFFRKETSVHTPFIKYFAVLDGKTYVKTARLKNDYIMIQSGLVLDNKAEILESFSKWEVIDEQEFLDAYKGVLESLSLSPQLVYAANPDDLKEVNI